MTPREVVHTLLETGDEFDARVYMLNPPRFNAEHYGFVRRSGVWTMWRQHPHGTSLTLTMNPAGAYYWLHVTVGTSTVFKTVLKRDWLESHPSRLVDAFRQAVDSTPDWYDAVMAFMAEIQDFQDESPGIMAENKWNPKGLRMNHRGQLLDKWGREMEIDTPEFEKKRMKAGETYPKWPKVLNPTHAAATPKRSVKEAEEPFDFLTYLDLNDEGTEYALRKYVTEVPAKSVVVRRDPDGFWLNVLRQDLDYRGFGPFDKEQLELFQNEWYGFADAMWRH